MDWVFKLIQEACKLSFYGKLTISFEKGKVVNINKSENVKPPKTT